MKRKEEGKDSSRIELWADYSSYFENKNKKGPTPKMQNIAIFITAKFYKHLKCISRDCVRSTLQ